MIVGIVSYGYIIATVAASLANADSGRARYQEKLKAIQSYLQVSTYGTCTCSSRQPMAMYNVHVLTLIQC